MDAARLFGQSGSPLRLGRCAALLTALSIAASASGDDQRTLVDDRQAPVVVSEAALAVHRSCLVFDGHNDLPWELRTEFGASLAAAHIDKGQPRLHTDIPRLRSGGVGAQYWSVYVPADSMRKGTAAHDVLTQIDRVRQMCREYPETFELGADGG